MYFFILLIIFVQIDSNQPEDSPTEAKKMRLLNYVGLVDIYLINLDRRPDRLKSMKAQLDLLNLPFTRYPAIDGKKVKEAKIDKINHDFGLHPETIIKLNENKQWIMKKRNSIDFGAVGCWMSHLQVYFKIRDKARETGIDGPVLILEDDIIMEKVLPYELKRYLKMLPNDWDMFFISSCKGECIEHIDDNLCRGKNMWLTISYVINGSKTADKLITLSNTDYPVVSDVVWRNHLNSWIHAYILKNEQLTEQDRENFESDISTSGTYKFSKLTNPVNLLID